jgi:hypothetical protein
MCGPSAPWPIGPACHNHLRNSTQMAWFELNQSPAESRLERRLITTPSRLVIATRGLGIPARLCTLNRVGRPLPLTVHSAEGEQPQRTLLIHTTIGCMEYFEWCFPGLSSTGRDLDNRQVVLTFASFRTILFGPALRSTRSSTLRFLRCCSTAPARCGGLFVCVAIGVRRAPISSPPGRVLRACAANAARNFPSPSGGGRGVRGEGR